MLLSILSLGITVQCKEQADQPTYLYAKYPIAVYEYSIKQKRAKKKGDPPKQVLKKKRKDTLVKAEKVKLLPMTEQDKMIARLSKKNLVKIEQSDGTIGYLDKKHLAGQPLVIVKDKLPYYKRPGSIKLGRLPIGTICLTLGTNPQKTMLKVFCGYVWINEEEVWIANKWIPRKGYSVATKDIDQARMIESAAEIIRKYREDEASVDELEVEAATNHLEVIIDTGGPLALAAQRALWDSADSQDQVQAEEPSDTEKQDPNDEIGQTEDGDL
ncbi:MAG: hypothetical protein D6767_05505 [Candidatus Hydrogenedentota bacterium]|nr:MAG: hypothetical protein D6767_05505 [Candidatus Hydrogenedentota bacterium]